jgi:hypothetical protein
VGSSIRRQNWNEGEKGENERGGLNVWKMIMRIGVDDGDRRIVRCGEARGIVSLGKLGLLLDRTTLHSAAQHTVSREEREGG